MFSLPRAVPHKRDPDSPFGKVHVAFTPAAQSAAWRSSHGAQALQAALVQIQPWLPAAAARWLPG